MARSAQNNNDTFMPPKAVTTEILSTTTTYRIDAYTDHATTIVETDVIYRVLSVQRVNDDSSQTSYFTSNYRVPDAAEISREASNPAAITSLSASCQSAAIAYSANLSANANIYTPSPGCCSALSPCFMSAGDVKVFYWPKAATNISQTITKAPKILTIVSEGYTYTSPSIYVIYRDVSADQGTAYDCYGIGTTSLALGVGPTISQTIQAYLPGELRTGHCFNGSAMEGIFDPADLETPLPNSVVTTMPGCVSVAQYNLEGNGTELWAHPQLLINKYLSQMDPAWSTCHRFWQGLYDPPTALTRVTELLEDPVSTYSDGSLQTLVTAEPLPMIPTPLVSSTVSQATNPPVPTITPLLPAHSPFQGSIANVVSPQVSTNPASSLGYGIEELTNILHDAEAPPKAAWTTELSVGQDPVQSALAPVSHASTQHSLAALSASSDKPIQGAKSVGIFFTGSDLDPGILTTLQGSRVSVIMTKTIGSFAMVLPAEGVKALSSSTSPASELIQPNTDGVGIVVSDDTTEANQEIASGRMSVLVRSSNVMADTTTYAIPFPSSSSGFPPGQQATLGNQQGASAQNPAPYYVVGNSQTLAVGGPSISISRQVISLGAYGSSLILGGSTVNIASLQTHATTTLTSNGLTFTSTLCSQIVVGGLTFTPGSVPLNHVAGSPVESTAVLTEIPGQSQVFTVGGSPITAAPEGPQFVVGGSTLVAGGSAATISGTPVSIAADGTSVFIGSSTLALHSAAGLLQVGSSTVTANGAGNFVIGGQTLAPGSAITASGSIISLAPSGSIAVLDGSTTALGSAPLTVGGQTLTPTTASGYVIAGQTVSPGGSAVTINGTLLSLAPTSSHVSGGMGSLIISGLGGTAAITPEAFTGVGVNVNDMMRRVIITGILCLATFWGVLLWL